MRRAACLAATVLALGLEAAGAFSTRLWRSTRAAHHRRAATASVLELTDADVATLDADAATSGGRPLLLLDAAAAWCGPCRIMKQVLDKSSRSYPRRGDIRIARSIISAFSFVSAFGLVRRLKEAAVLVAAAT